MIEPPSQPRTDAPQGPAHSGATRSTAARQSALATARGLTDVQLAAVHRLLDEREDVVATWPPAKQRWVYDLLCIFALHLFRDTAAAAREWPAGRERIVSGAGQYYDDVRGSVAEAGAATLDGIVAQLQRRPLMTWRQLITRTFLTLQAHQVVERADQIPGTVALPVAAILAAVGRATDSRAVAIASATNPPHWEAALHEVLEIAAGEAGELQTWITAHLADVVSLPSDVTTLPIADVLRACIIPWMLRLQALHAICDAWLAPWAAAESAVAAAHESAWAEVGERLCARQAHLSSSQGELSSQDHAQLVVLQTARDLLQEAPPLAVVAQWFAAAVAPLHSESLPLSCSVLLGLAGAGTLDAWSSWIERLTAHPVLHAYRLADAYAHEQSGDADASEDPGTLAADLAALVQDRVRVQQCRAALHEFVRATASPSAAAAQVLLQLIPDPDTAAVTDATAEPSGAQWPTWMASGLAAAGRGEARGIRNAVEWIQAEFADQCDFETLLDGIEDQAERFRRCAVVVVRCFAKWQGLNDLLTTTVEASVADTTAAWAAAARDELFRSLATLPLPLHDNDGHLLMRDALQDAPDLWPHAVTYAAHLRLDKYDVPVSVVNFVCAAFGFDAIAWLAWLEARRATPLAVAGAVIRMYQQLIDTPEIVDTETLAEAQRLLAQWEALREANAAGPHGVLVAQRLISDFETAREAEGDTDAHVFNALRRFVDPDQPDA